jgi:hypothetical protein
MGIIKTAIAVAVGVVLGQSPGFVSAAVDALKGGASATFGLTARVELTNQALEAQRVWIVKEVAKRQEELRALDEKLKANDRAIECLKDYEKATKVDPTLPNRCDLKPIS